MKIDLIKFNELVQQKLLSVQKHDKANLLIWNYTPVTQFDRKWTPETIMARGLITDLDGNIIARPFTKFFNLSEHEGEDSKLPPLPQESFEVFEKLDGSLGILYFIEDKPFIATRGSFLSDQALEGTKMLWQKYSKVPFDKHGTYLFEIIYPENRIVVDYKGKRDLILLSAFVTETGEEFSYDLVQAFAKTWHIPIVKRLDGITDISTIAKMQKNNAEGFVIRYKSGVRAKVKFEEYVRLHRLITGVNAKTIWDLLRNNQPFDELLDRVPDEYYDWVQKTRDDLTTRFKDIRYHAQQIFILEHGDNRNQPRKETAMRFKQYPQLQGILFAMLDNKNYEEIIWKMLRPTATKPFKEDIDL